jgi:hypothetical protein
MELSKMTEKAERHIIKMISLHKSSLLVETASG